MKTLIRNACIIPMTAPGHTVRGDLCLDGKKIAAVGTSPQDSSPDRTIDGTDSIVLPAFVNAHTHLSMELMRNYKDDSPNLQKWLSEIFPIEAKLTPHDVRTASTLGLIELIQSGTTTFNDMYFFADETAEAANELGIRACIGLTLFGDLDDTKKRLENDAKLERIASASSGRIRIDIAPHAIYTCSADTYRYGHDWAKANGRHLHTHLSETRKENEDCIAEHGKTPLQYLTDIGATDGIPCVFAHAVHLTEDDIRLMTQLNAAVVHNPTSNCKLASGIAPVGTYRRRGIPLALGTDGSSSNNNQNMVEEMHIASLLSTVSSGDIGNLTAYEILEMATIGGARALGLDDKIGTVEVGKEADLAVVDCAKSHLTPLNDPFSAVVFAMQASDIDTVFCQGTMIMDHRNVMGIDVKRTIAETNACWDDIRRR